MVHAEALAPAGWTVKVISSQALTRPCCWLVRNLGVLIAVSTIGKEATLTRTSYVESRFMTYDFMKRLIDLLGAATALLLLAPILAVLAVVVKLTSPGPVFFSTVRQRARNP